MTSGFTLSFGLSSDLHFHEMCYTLRNVSEDLTFKLSTDSFLPICSCYVHMRPGYLTYLTIGTYISLPSYHMSDSTIFLFTFDIYKHQNYNKLKCFIDLYIRKDNNLLELSQY